ncbi:MAG: immunoglobulin-like domain-containing protein [Candidatus Izemoplasmatales bacterium]
MKKIIPFILALVMVLGLWGCKAETTIPVATTTTTSSIEVTTTATALSTSDPNQELIDTVYDWLSLGDISALLSTSPRLILPTSRTGVVISWDINPDGYIASNGVITQPDHLSGNKEVTLTATLTIGELVRTKVFTATVLALPSPENNPPIINETFVNYEEGNIAPQMISGGTWAPVSGKTSSTSLFSVVSTVGANPVPGAINALEIRSQLENQIVAPLFHSFEILVIEADVYQSANGSPIYLQTSQSSPAIGFGLSGAGSTASIYYRTDNGSEIKTQIQLNTWVTIRLEVDLVNKTIEFFYYDLEGHLIPCTPFPVHYTYGEGGFQSLFIRSGSSNTIAQQGPAYITNIVANRIESLPKPIDPIKLGAISGISAIEVIENGGSYSPAEPVVKGYYGAQNVLVKDTDYTLTITNPVDVDVNGNYIVTFQFTNIHNPSDVLTINQSVVIYAPGDPNVIMGVSSTIAHALSHETDITVTAQRAEGILHYVVSDTPLTKEQVVASIEKESIVIDSLETLIEGVVVNEDEKVYLVIELNGLSNLIEHEVTIQTLVVLTTPQEFYDTLSVTVDTGYYYVLGNDLDFTGFVWNAPAANSFSDTLDGQAYKIYNLDINRVGSYGGLFSVLKKNALIKNIVFENVSLVSDSRGSAIISGESGASGEGSGSVLVENLVFINSSVVVSIANPEIKDAYGALIVGRIRYGNITIRNIAVIDSQVDSEQNYGGGLVAGSEDNIPVTISDIYMENFLVKESSAVTAEGKIVGGVIGRPRGPITIERVYGFNVNVLGKNNVGAITGKIESECVYNISDVYINGSLSFVDPAKAEIIAGAVSGIVNTNTNVYASGYETEMSGHLGVLEENLVTHTLTQEESWWTTNIPAILENDLWYFVSDRPMLKIVPVSE